MTISVVETAINMGPVSWRKSVLTREETGAEYPEKTLEVKLRSTETQPTYNICGRGGRRD